MPEPDISADGRYVTFATGSVFAANDDNGVGAFDAHVRDMNGAAMTRISVDMNGNAGASGHSEISADGKRSRDPSDPRTTNLTDALDALVQS